MSKIIVIGDSIIDSYLYGHITRNNPENSYGHIIQYDHEELKLGGALSVSFIISCFDQKSFVYTAVGDDYYDFVKEQLDLNNIRYCLEPVRNTTTKIRLVTENCLCKNRLDRDFENNCQFLFSNVYINSDDIIVIQDYGKGFCSDKLMNFLYSFNNKIIVDPYINSDWNKYPHPFLIKCNRKEAEKATNNECGIPEMLKILSLKHQCSIVITDGENGMFLYDKNKCDWDWIAPKKAKVKDVCGAGDTVLATIATGIAKDINLFNCCSLASLTASEQIQTIGINKVQNCFI